MLYFIAEMGISLLGLIFSAVAVSVPLAKTSSGFTYGVSANSVFKLQTITSTSSCGGLNDVALAYIAFSALAAAMFGFNGIANAARAFLTPTKNLRDIVTWVARGIAGFGAVCSLIAFAMALALFLTNWCNSGSLSDSNATMDAGGALSIVAFLCAIAMVVVEAILNPDEGVTDGNNKPNLSASTNRGGIVISTTVVGNNTNNNTIGASRGFTTTTATTSSTEPTRTFGASSASRNVAVAAPAPPPPTAARNRFSRPEDAGLTADYSFDEGTGYWYSADSGYYYDEKSAMYYDQQSQKWYDPTTGQWH